MDRVQIFCTKFRMDKVQVRVRVKVRVMVRVRVRLLKIIKSELCPF